MTSLKLELRLQPESERKHDSPTNVYNLVTDKPLILGEPVYLYLSYFDLSDVIAYANAPNLDKAITELFDHSINLRLDGGDSSCADHLGWPAIFRSDGFVQAGGNAFFGYDPFVAYPIPIEALSTFAQLYTNRVLRAEIEALPQDDELGRILRERGIKE